MIIGYQIVDKNGRNWHDNIDQVDNPRTVLSEESAITELKQLRRTRPERGFAMLAVLDGDIEHPFFEWSLAATRDQYKTLCINAAHIPYEEHEALSRLGDDSDCNMIFRRDTGWFIKLYDEAEYNNNYEGLGEAFSNILNAALKAGYRMIEIDLDGLVHEEFPVFEY